MSQDNESTTHTQIQPMSDLDLIRKYYNTNSAKLQHRILFKKNNEAARKIQRSWKNRRFRGKLYQILIFHNPNHIPI